ncbi:hypothetical protein LPJ66_003658, partial [Kickxella alabastrina]
MPVSPSPSSENGNEYEIDRIIGRRITTTKTEYFIFWKGYKVEDCTWEPITSETNCEDALIDFEKRCTNLRFERMANSRLPEIDRFENEGLATLIDVAMEAIPHSESAFHDRVRDFAFVTGEVGDLSPLVTDQSAVKKTSPYSRRQLATLGWNRCIVASKLDDANGMAAINASDSPWTRPTIIKIVNSIRDNSGRVYYLSEWSDKELTWEKPSAFDGAMGPLMLYEGTRSANKRKDLVAQFQRAKHEGDSSIMQSPQGKSNLERKPVRSSVPDNKTPAVQAPSDMADITGLTSPSGRLWFDLGTSNILPSKGVVESNAPASKLSTPESSRPMNSAVSSHSVAFAKKRTMLSDSEEEAEDNLDVGGWPSSSESTIDSGSSMDAPEDGETRDVDFEDCDMDDAIMVSGNIATSAPASIIAFARVPARATASSFSAGNVSVPRKRLHSDESRRCGASSVPSLSQAGTYPFVKIDHVAGSKLQSRGLSELTLKRISSERRRALRDINSGKRVSRQQPAETRHQTVRGVSSRFLIDSDEEMLSGRVSSSCNQIPLSSVDESRAAASRQRSNNPVLTKIQTDDAKCSHCPSLLPSGSEGISCNGCGLSYHRQCYDRVLSRVSIALSSSDSVVQCALCTTFEECAIEKVLALRDNAPGGKYSPANVDIAVKWKNKSYRHLSWVPRVWQQAVSPNLMLGTLMVQAKSGLRPPALEDAFDRIYLEPDVIIQTLSCNSSEKKQRKTHVIAAGLSGSKGAWDFYINYKSVRVVWKGQSFAEATWEALPSPIDSPQDYIAWLPVCEAWQRAELVSLNKRLQLKSKAVATDGFVAAERQPEYLQGGVMYDYQLEGANFLNYKWKHGEPAILADDPGLGKTIQTIAFLSMVYHSTIPDSLRGIEATKSNCGTFPFLIVVPSTLIDNWMAEFRAWAPFLVVCKLSGQAASREIQLETTLFRKQAQGKLDLRCHVVLASYESIIKRGVPQFTNPSFVWQTIVFDEGHRLKNNQSKTYQELKKFNARQRVVLTGTPLQNDLRELFNLLGFIDPDKSKDMVKVGAGFDVTDERSVGLVRDMINPYILRRTRDKIPDLVPPKYELILPVPMSELQRKLYRATLTKNTKLLYDIARALRKNDKNMGAGAGSGVGFGDPRASTSALLLPAMAAGQDTTAPSAKLRGVASLQNVLMEVRKIVSHPYLISGIEPTFETTDEATKHLISSCGKLQVLHAMMPELCARGHRMLIFSQFKDTLIILQDYFDAQGIVYCHIDGDTPQQQRQTRINMFNAPRSTAMVFLSTTRTGGLGINLTTADVVIIFDCDFNPHVDTQAMARAHRIGQQNPVTIFKFVTANSVEERIIMAATKKLALDHLIIQNIGKEKSGLESELPDSLVEQALRHDVSLLFEDSAEAATLASAACYNSEWAKELLDQCEVALEEEMQCRKVESANRQSASMLVSFSRVCTIDLNGNARPIVNDLSVATNLDDTMPDADVWSRLLDMSNSDKATGASNETNDKNRLRIRKRKVDYMVDDIHEATDDIKAQKTSHTLAYDDSDFVDTPGMDADEDGDLSDVATDEPKFQSNATLPVSR